MVRRALIDPIRDAASEVRPALRIAVLVAMLAACGPAHLQHTAEVTSPIGTAQAAGAAEQAKLPPMVLGVQTHFSQGWTASTLAQAQQVGAPMLRDSLPWADTEKVRGSYSLNTPAAQALAAACAGGQRLLLTAVPTNPLYDGGGWVSSPAGNAAFAAYLAALADRFGPCLAAIEVGNEINGSGTLAYAAGTDRAAAYVATLKAVRARIGGRAAILGGSTNMIGTGFLKTLFAAGMLPTVDGIAVHPYRLRAEGLDVEMAQLNAAMDAAGKRVPIWVSEFSVDSRNQPLAAGELVKQATMLAASGAAQASWYALIDQRWFPNMGLYAGTSAKAQAGAYRLMQQLLARGRPQRLDLGDPLLFAYRFGADTTVVWGAPRALTVQGGEVRDARGAPAPTFGISESPLVITGTTAIRFGASTWIADTLMGWGTPQWRYAARLKADTSYRLPLFDDQFTSYFGDRWYRPLRINTTSAAPGGTAAAPIRAVWRYVAPGAQAIDIGGCFAKAAAGDGVDLTVTAAGKVLWRGVLTGQLQLPPLSASLAAGDAVELIAGPNQTAGGDSFNLRMILFKRGASEPVGCPD
ncbi:hypothetical protein NSE01_33260 [Novosphingobium sediminis]|uniref:Asl1-like glycosyl hydrolase catalytic domain-containing protein n=1 Tax=Novosphingobium sediminis TaxID=707214 RepID=A0A512AP75_9SPHN|nr:hypothetical protein [Novosphingobium sediminis]GEO01494.1 hypothetical protein NSE01_33260 [Novosphingobium sediminis]